MNKEILKRDAAGFDDIKYVVQFRGKRDTENEEPASPWHWRTMAAFDVIGAAETYFGKQGWEGCPWEYRLCEVEEVDP